MNKQIKPLVLKKMHKKLPLLSKDLILENYSLNN